MMYRLHYKVEWLPQFKHDKIFDRECSCPLEAESKIQAEQFLENIYDNIPFSNMWKLIKIIKCKRG